MIADLFNDDKMLTLMWNILNDNQELMNEFEALYNAPEKKEARWKERADQLATKLKDILQSCVDIYDDEGKNNVIWGIQRPKKERILSMPSSMTWMGLSILDIIRSINREL